MRKVERRDNEYALRDIDVWGETEPEIWTLTKDQIVERIDSEEYYDDALCGPSTGTDVGGGINTLSMMTNFHRWSMQYCWQNTYAKLFCRKQHLFLSQW